MGKTVYIIVEQLLCVLLQAHKGINFCIDTVHVPHSLRTTVKHAPKFKQEFLISEYNCALSYFSQLQVQRSEHSKSILMHLHGVQPFAALQEHLIRSLHALTASGIVIHTGS